MAHLAHISRVSDAKGEDSNNMIIEKVLQSNPLLESFGNAKTGRNDNSSRFGKFTQLQFDSEEQGTALVGSRCVTYLLEKSRVITQNDSKERNYHIFHQLLAAPENVKVQLLTSKSLTARDFRFTSAGDVKTSSIEGETDASRFLKTMEALSLLGVNESTRNQLQRIIAGILYLGQLNFVGDTEKSAIDPSQDTVVAQCCTLLGLQPEAFKERTTSRSLVVGGESSSLLVPLSREQAVDARDALAKDLYFRLFSWLVMVINTSTAVTEASGKPQERTISLLDIFGFEYFVINRFEQLNINYANEKLQQKFTEDVFATVQAEYKSEGLQWENISYKDNSDVLELLEGKQGVFASLNEECCVPKGSDMNYLSKLSTRQAKHPCFSQNVHMSREGFCIHHYAGKVTYNVIGFVERNKDTLLADMRHLMLLSDNDLIYQVYSPLDWSNPSTNGTGFTRARSDSGDSDSETNSHEVVSPSSRIGISIRSYAATPGQKRGESYLKSETVLTKFKSQLTSLMTSISKTNVQYVRCIKPNSLKSSTIYDRAMVVEQLRCAGVIEAIRISRAAYPYRLTHTEFLDHFGILRPQSWFTRRASLAPGAKCKALVDEILAGDHGKKRVMGAAASIRADSPVNKSTPFEVGKTRIYFSSGVLEVLEQLRGEAFTRATRTLQKIARGFIYRKRYARIRKAIVKSQSLARCFLSQRRYRRLKSSIIRIQSSIRVYLAKSSVYHCRRQIRSTQIQSILRMRKHHHFYKKLLRALRKLQAWYKMYHQRKKYLIALENQKKQSDLQNQLDSMKQRLLDEEAYRSQMQKEMETKLLAEKAEMERKFKEEMRLQLEREEAERQRVIASLSVTAPTPVAPPIEQVPQPVIDEQSIRDEIRRELEDSMRQERELLKQQLREEMKQELAVSAVKIIDPSPSTPAPKPQTPSISPAAALAAPSRRPSILSTGSSVVIAKQNERANSPHVQVHVPPDAYTNFPSPKSLSSMASSSDTSTPRMENNTPTARIAEISSFKNLTERRGSHESGVTSLESSHTVNAATEGM
jgi:myosin V